MSCVKIAPTSGTPSELFDTIYNEIANKNESRATELYSQFLDSKFMDSFGNWITAYNAGKSALSRTTDTGEPKLFKDTEDGSFYYLDKDHNKISFPRNANSLVEIVDSEILDSAVNYLALNYLAKVKNLSFKDINLEATEKSMSLSEYINEVINERLAEAEEKMFDEDVSPEDMVNYALVLDNFPLFLNNMVELKHLIKDKFRQLNLELMEREQDNEDVNDESLISPEEKPRDSGFDTNPIKRKVKDNVRTNAKLRLSLIPDLTSTNIYFGGHNYIPFSDVYNKLSDILTDNYLTYDSEGNIIDPISQMTERLEKLVEKRPEFKYILDVLVDPNTERQVKLELYQAFNTQKIEPISSNITNKKEKLSTIVRELEGRPEGDVLVPVYKQEVKELSKSASKSSSLRREWNYLMYERFIKGKTDGNAVAEKMAVFVLRLENVANRINISKSPTLEFKNAEGISQYEEAKNTIQSTFKYLFGYELNPKAIDDLLIGNGKTTIRDNAFKIISTLAKDLKSKNNNFKRAASSQDSYVDLVASSNVIRQIGDAESLYINSDSDSSVNLVSGKGYLYQNKSHMSTVINMWRNNPDELLRMYNSDPYTQSSEVIKKLLLIEERAYLPEAEINQRVKENLDAFAVQIFTDFYYQEGNNNKIALSTKDVTKSKYIEDYLNKILLNRVRPTPVKTTVLADKSSDMHLKMNYFVSAAKAIDSHTGKIIFEQQDNNNPIATLREHFLSELNRRKRAEAVYKEAERTGNYKNLRQHFHYDAKAMLKGELKRGNAFKSQLLPELSEGYNGEYLTPEIKEKAEEIRKMLYEDGMLAPRYGNKFTSKTTETINSELGPIESNRLMNAIDEFINLTLQNRIEDTYNQLVEQKLIDIVPNKNSANVPGYELEHKVDGKLVADYYLKQFDRNHVGKAIAADFYVNGVLRNIEFSKLFSGDVAYYKNMVDYKKRTPATNTDGVMPMWERGFENFQYAVIDSVEIQSLFHAKMLETWGEKVAAKYESINAADAQAWITPKRWRDIMRAINWTPAHDTLYEKMMSGKNETYTEDELHIMAQPLKGTYFWRNSLGEPLFFKYSQAVLTPLMAKGNGLEVLLNKMEEGNISEVLTADAVKVGAPLTTKAHDEAGNFVQDLELNVHTADSRGWKLQQDLTPKTFHDTMVGSQIQKNIFAALKHALNEDFINDKGELIKGIDIANDIREATQGKVNLGLKRLLREFGVGTDGRIQNVDALYNNLIDELRSRGSEPNIIEALEKRLPLNMIPQVKNKIDNLFSTMITKRLVRIKTNGGSFIQMSNFGMNYANAEASGVILHPNLGKMTGGPLTTFEPTFYDQEYKFDTKDENGNPLTVTRKKVRPAGVFISGSFISKFIPNYRSFSAEQLFGTYDDAGNLVKEGMIDRRILENVIGYRIPNQGLASNDALQIVGILPETNGDTIVAYTGITTKTGSDFDIDKMYVMMPSYRRVLDEKQKRALADYVSTQFRGDTVRETITNIFEKAKELDLNLDIDIDLKQKGRNDKEFLSEYNTLKDLFVDAVLSSDNLHNAGVQDLIEQFTHVDKSKVENVARLQYETKPGTDGYFSNKLIEAYKTTLTDENSIKEVAQPIDYRFLKETIVDLTTPEVDNASMSLNPFETLADVDTAYDFKAGKLGVGIEANIMVDINRSGTLNVLNNLVNTELGVEEVARPIVELDQKYSNKLSEKDMQEFIEDLNPKNPQELIDELENVTTMASMVAILNAFVDIAKDPFITRGNWTSTTTNLGNTMLRLGVNPLYVATIMAQPSIKAKFIVDGEFVDGGMEDITVLLKTLRNVYNNPKQLEIIDKILEEAETPELLSMAYSEAMNELKQQGIITVTTSEQDMFEDTIEYNPGFESEYRPLMTNIHRVLRLVTRDKGPAESDNFNITLSLRELREQIKNKEKFDITYQKQILEYMSQISKLNKQLRDNVRYSRIDTDGAKGSISNYLLLSNIKKDLLNPTAEEMVLNGFESKLQGTILGVYDNAISKVYEIARKNPQVFPDLQESNIQITNVLSNILFAEDIKDEEVYNAIKQTMLSKQMYDFIGFENGEMEQTLIDFPLEFLDFRRANKGKYAILDALEVSLVNAKGPIASMAINMANRDRDSFEQIKLTRSWEQLLKDNPEFGEKLVKYSYASTGFKFSSTQFYSLIPNSYYINKDAHTFISNYKFKFGDMYQFLSAMAYNNETIAKKIKYVSQMSTFTNKTELYLSNNSSDVATFMADKAGKMYRIKNNVYLANTVYESFSKSLKGVKLIPISSNQINANGKSITTYDKAVMSEAGALVVKNLVNKRMAKNETSHSTETEIETPTTESKTNLLDEHKDAIVKNVGIEGYNQVRKEILESDTLTHEQVQDYIEKCIGK